ncbi:hypothetical protein J4423_03920 [Candidatus Pacearchaeota archaeon]|nr:hypothetical protein [Candidatus Pacearchaeota archaeon]
MEYIYGALLLHKLGHPVTEENLNVAAPAASAHAPAKEEKKEEKPSESAAGLASLFG